MPGYYPVFLQLRGRLCVVVGGGEVAQRKVEALVEAGARVRVISPSLSPRLSQLAASGQVGAEPRPYATGALKGAFLAIAATDDPEANRQVVREARRRRVLLNVVDEPRACSFIMPSVVRRGELVLAISTGGLSPALSRKVREDLEAHFGAEYAL
ncbi:MAG: bifunctional precorrin-2 dehydrogenase/sirohydrochlorin ferrochelatase, partial [Chloroflexota bacterium]